MKHSELESTIAELKVSIYEYNTINLGLKWALRAVANESSFENSENNPALYKKL